MSLSKRTIEMLLDLVEIKISHMNISDHEDARALETLKGSLAELQALTAEKPIAIDTSF